MGFSVASLYATFGLQVDRKSWQNGQSRILSLKTALMGLAVAAGARAITGIVTSAAEAGTALVTMSRATGLSTQALQEWTYVAGQSGAKDPKQLVQGIGRIETAMRNFAQGRGGKTLAATMHEFGVSQAQAAAAMRSPGGFNAEIFKLSDKLKKMGEGPERAALLRALGGPRAAQALSMLTEGSDKLRERIKHLHDIGGVVPDKQLEDLKKFDNSLKDIHVALHGLAMNVVGALAPALTDMARRASEWIAENRDLISGALSGAVRALALAFSVLGHIIAFVGNTIRWLFGGSAGATALLIGLAAAILNVVIPAVVAWTASMIPLAISVIAATWPFLLLAAVIAGIAYGISKLIKYGPQIMSALGGAWDWVRGKAEDFWHSIAALPGRIRDAFERMGQAIKNAISEAIDYVLAKIQGAANYVESSWLGKLLNTAAGAVGINVAGTNAMRHGMEHAGDYGSVTSSKKLSRGSMVPTSTVTTIGPTTLTFNGVKDAADAGHKLGDEHERRMRELAAVHGGF